MREGAPARWEVRLAGPVGYDMWVSGMVVRGPRPTLAAGEMPPGVADEHGRHHAEAVLKPLRTYHPSVYGELSSGATRLVLTVPTRHDDRTEGRESVTLKVSVDRKHVKRTVWVR